MRRNWGERKNVYLTYEKKYNVFQLVEEKGNGQREKSKLRFTKIQMDIFELIVSSHSNLEIAKPFHAIPHAFNYNSRQNSLETVGTQ